MSFSEPLGICLTKTSQYLGGLYLTPVGLSFDYLTWSDHPLQIFMESIIVLATLAHAVAFRMSRIGEMRTRAQTTMNHLYMDGFAYYLVCNIVVYDVPSSNALKID